MDGSGSGTGEPSQNQARPNQTLPQALVVHKDKWKETAQKTCMAQEFALLSCYKNITMFAALRCQEEHNAFWSCFETEIEGFKQVT